MLVRTAPGRTHLRDHGPAHRMGFQGVSPASTASPGVSSGILLPQRETEFSWNQKNSGLIKLLRTRGTFGSVWNYKRKGCIFLAIFKNK